MSFSARKLLARIHQLELSPLKQLRPDQVFAVSVGEAGQKTEGKLYHHSEHADPQRDEIDDATVAKVLEIVRSAGDAVEAGWAEEHFPDDQDYDEELNRPRIAQWSVTVGGLHYIVYPAGFVRPQPMKKKRQHRTKGGGRALPESTQE